MKILILNGNPDEGNVHFDKYLEELQSSLGETGHDVEIFLLREMDIQYCDGCHGCWLRTPGECLVSDHTQLIRKSFVNSDLVISASPIRMGFISSLLKKGKDKFIPLVLPFVRVENGEIHHKPRYDKYPLLGFILDKGLDGDNEDVEIISQIAERNAMQLGTHLSFVSLTSKEEGELADEINGL